MEGAISASGSAMELSGTTMDQHRQSRKMLLRDVEVSRSFRFASPRAEGEDRTE